MLGSFDHKRLDEVLALGDQQSQGSAHGNGGAGNHAKAVTGLGGLLGLGLFTAG